MSPLIEPALSAENAKAIIALVNQGKAKLKKEYNEEIYKNLNQVEPIYLCLLYTSDAADDLLCVDLGGRRIFKKKNTTKKTQKHHIPPQDTSRDN